MDIATKVKERPIIFSTPMVQAILEGRKTQTRRIVTPSRSGSCDTHHKSWLDWDKIYPNNPFGIKVHSKINDTIHRVFPHYNKGDLLWVREAWCRMDGELFFRASVKYPETLKWKPSIHMPKAAARIWLQVKDVRVERVKDISESDAISEGVGFGFQMNAGWPDYNNIKDGVCQVTQDTPEMSFATLWDSINGSESWDSNPWVWVVEFEKIEH